MRVKFKRFKFGYGTEYEFGSEGRVIAETDMHYLVKTSWFHKEWVLKSYCLEIKEVK